MPKVAFAAAAHPDDVEFLMAGTLVLLGRAGYELHYMNVANGSCGSWTMSAEETVRTRTAEARAAAESIGAHFHFPLVDDLMLYYEDHLVRKLCAIVREVNPEIVLLQSPQDYMEDHQNAARLMVTATFCRNMPNYASIPPVDAVDSDVAVYHSMPHGLRGPLMEPIAPHFFVDIGSTIADKRSMLSCHRSQKEWLDQTQGFDNYIHTMEEDTLLTGRVSGKFEHAEGWRRHLSYGFGPAGFDPLCDALGSHVLENEGGAAVSG